LVIAGIGVWAKALSLRGALAAVGIGTVVLGAGGWEPAWLVVLFFASSSLLTRLGRVRKREAEAAFAKSGRRDAGQVLANGGVAAVLSLAYGMDGDPVWMAGVMGSLAAATADTWATEVGGYSAYRPRLVTTGERVAHGTSGGVTALGTAAGAGGAIIIALAGMALGAPTPTGVAVAAAGFVAAGIDSLLGATVQAMYYCPRCQRETEQAPLHRCGQATQYRRGWRWLNNDGVNFLATAVGAALAMAAVGL
jgi:uncharacterized protein (TIGR00297 family)